MNLQLDWIGRNKWELDTPAAVIDLAVLEQNIREMASFAAQAGVTLRPHVKAHKMLAIAKRQLEAGAGGLAVAKLGEAEVMLQSGARDILVANQVVTREKIARLLRLNEEARVTCAVDSLENARALSEAAQSLGRRLPVLIEVDTGLRRCGTLPGEPTVKLAQAMARLPGLEINGIMTHAGHVYAAREAGEVARIGSAEGELMVQTAEMLRKAGLPCRVVSVGSTPTARHAGLVPGVTEIRPGNYVFYDAVQVALGVAQEGQCALSIMATVTSRPAPDRAVIDAGSKVLALDRGAHGAGTVRGFGLVKGYPDYIIERLSEEHGILSVPPGADLHIGQRLEIIPNHACSVINLFDAVAVVRDEEVIDVWRVDARGTSR